MFDNYHKTSIKINFTFWPVNELFRLSSGGVSHIKIWQYVNINDSKSDIAYPPLTETCEVACCWYRP
jgi:hypothetical protein